MRPEARRLRLERLEERTLLAVFSVTNINDSGAGSLRQAILDANSTAGADEIVFSSLFDTPQTIHLTSAQLTLTDSATTTITGPGAHLLSISGGGGVRVFEVAAGASASLSGLTITRGSAAEGGGLRNSGAVELTRVAVRENVAAVFTSIAGEGGGLYNDFNATMTIVDSTISNNGYPFAPVGLVDFIVAEAGGGIFNRGALTMLNSTVSGNAAKYGAGVHNGDSFNFIPGTATIINCTISDNRSVADVGGVGVLNLGIFGSELTMFNSIVSGNYGAGAPSNLDEGGGNVFGSHNLIGGDAKLGALAYYGGTLPTMMPAPDSPVHGAGTTGPGIPTTDQMGNLRSAQPTIGALEGSYSLTVNTTDAYGLAPGEVTLAIAVHRANVIPGPNTIAFSSLFDAPQTIDHRVPAFVTDPAGTTIDGQGRLTIQGHGGIRVKNGSLALSGVTLSGGSVQLQNFDGNVALSGVTVTGNSVTSHEDALIQNGGLDRSVYFVTSLVSLHFDPFTGLPVQRHFGGTMTLTGCTISDNDGIGFDTAIISNGSVPTIDDLVIPDLEASLTITDSLISDNGKNSRPRATIKNDHLLTISRSTIRDNHVDKHGGGLLNLHTATLTDSTFSGNSAYGSGGGIATMGDATLTMTNCTLSGNAAGGNFAIQTQPIHGFSGTVGGGGLFNFGTATLVNCTISGNTGFASNSGATYGARGGGLFNMATITLSNTIIAGNTAPILVSEFSPDVRNRGTLISLGHNLIGISDGSTGWGATDLTGTADEPLDPLLAPLGDYGGPTHTMPPLAGSPAIDAGDPAFDPNDYDPPLDYDQRGVSFARVIGGRIDIGAVETQPNPIPGDYNRNNAVSAADYVLWRDTLGKTGVSPYSGADGNGNTTIDAGDYIVWRANFGASIAGGSQSPESEPQGSEAGVALAEADGGEHSSPAKGSHVGEFLRNSRTIGLHSMGESSQDAEREFRRNSPTWEQARLLALLDLLDSLPDRETDVERPEWDFTEDECDPEAQDEALAAYFAS